jgi:hypothetical protein
MPQRDWDNLLLYVLWSDDVTASWMFVCLFHEMSLYRLSTSKYLLCPILRNGSIIVLTVKVNRHSCSKFCRDLS